MMRSIAAAVLVASALASSSAFAQSTYVHHRYCLRHGSSEECAYNSMAQCKASMHGSADFCVQNSAPINH